jgi:acyl-CoA synthetase (AMP-forming)/AMP-acid ligase II
VTAAPNFAYELALARTKDEDLDGLDLGDVSRMVSGAERVHVSTIKRFVQRFARFDFPERAIRPSYGLAEATLYVATHQEPGAQVVHFEPETLSAGRAERCQEGTALVSYGTPNSPAVRIVDPETSLQSPPGVVGEIWVQGDNVALGYWNKPVETEETFHATLAGESEAGRWLRTGDLGFLSDGELFIIGRMKDLLIVRGRNHYPDDIEATVQARSGGRVAAISVPDAETEKLVVVIEFKKGSVSDEEFQERIRILKDEVTAAISQFHELAVGDIVVVPPGSIPITTSGKIRRSGCVEKYGKNEFVRCG